jgi:glycine amidinotransferase
MRINSSNEWGRLKSVVVGSATNANWPSNDPVFAEEAKKTTWTETPVPSGPVPQWIIDEANEDLEILADTLTKLKISVYRPKDLDFVRLGGMYNYCPRDRLIIAGKTVIVPNMMYPCRNMEEVALDAVLDAAEHYVYMPRDQGMIMDAANVCRMNDRWLFLESPSGNRTSL